MSYRYAREQKKRRNTFLVLALFLLLLFFTPVTRWVYSLFEKPILAAYGNINYMTDTSSNLIRSWYSKAKILEENTSLKRENERLKIDALRVQYLESFLEKDRLFNINKAPLVDIVKKQQNQFLINQGSLSSDIAAGDPVFADTGELIGFVREVYSHSTLVYTLTHTEIVTEAILFPSEKSISLKGNGNALLGSVARDVELAQGDIVFAQSYFSQPLGRVSKIDFDPRDPVQKIYIAPLRSLSEIQFVAVGDSEDM